MRQSFFDYCRQYHKDALLREWDTARNAPLTPQMVSYGSHTPVWWRCANGHEWEAVVYTRTRGSGYPFCAGKKTQTGFNDLATQNPELAQQWDYAKNIPVLPADVTSGSHRLVWWKCEKGHRWVVSVNNRTSVKDSNCPYCSGKKLLKGENDLQTLYPDIAKEWDWKLNSNKPSDYFGNSNYKVHWVCAKGHKYEAKINDRTKSKGTGCPYCAGNKVLVGFNDLQTLFPELEKEWDYEKNNRDIETISAHSGYKAWWICANNHSYLAKVNDRTKSKGTGCPYCANRKVLIGYNDLFTTEPQLKAEWNYDKNELIKPFEIMPNSGKKYWWKCKRGHEWMATANNRVSLHTGCPVCSRELHTSFPEQAILYYISKYEDVINRYIIEKNEVDIYS